MRLKYLITVVLTVALSGSTARAADEAKPAIPAKGTWVLIELKPQTTKPHTTETITYIGEVLESNEKELKISAGRVGSRVVYEHPLSKKVPFGERLLRNVGVSSRKLTPPEEMTIAVGKITKFEQVSLVCNLPNLEKVYAKHFAKPK